MIMLILIHRRTHDHAGADSYIGNHATPILKGVGLILTKYS